MVWPPDKTWLKIEKRQKYCGIWACKTDHVIQAKRTDIVLKDKELDHPWLIDIAVLEDGRVKDKEQGKVEKYQDLAKELKKFWNKSVTVVPIVV